MAARCAYFYSLSIRYKSPAELTATNEKMLLFAILRLFHHKSEIQTFNEYEYTRDSNLEAKILIELNCSNVEDLQSVFNKHLDQWPDVTDSSGKFNAAFVQFVDDCFLRVPLSKEDHAADISLYNNMNVDQTKTTADN